ncbi:MAG: hypothetical protein Q8O46_02740 [bacterium]|nr:hypothetical protein [bacterium]
MKKSSKRTTPSSLDSSLAQKLTGIIPLGVKESFDTFYKIRAKYIPP